MLLQLFHSNAFWQSRNVWLTIALAVVLALAAFPSLHAFKWTSGASVFFIVLLVCIVALFSIPGSGFDACDGMSIHESIGRNYSFDDAYYYYYSDYYGYDTHGNGISGNDYTSYYYGYYYYGNSSRLESDSPYNDSCNGATSYGMTSFSSIRSISLFVFAFTCHQVVYSFGINVCSRTLFFEWFC
jgi:amino acid permease